MMKKYFGLIIISLFFMPDGNAQWYWQHPIPQGNSINDITHTGSIETFYAVGNFGTIIKNNISDTTWTILDSITDIHLNGITFTEEGTGYIVGEEGLILQSVEEDIWDVKESFTHYKLNSIVFPDEDTGFAVGHKGIILKILPDTCIQLSPVTFKELNAIDFVNQTTGFIVGDSGLILRTTNSGVNWTATNLNDSIYFTNCHFPSETIGYAIGKKGEVWKTINGGDNWTDVSFQSVGDDLHGIHFYNDTIGMISGRQGRILETLDGGNSWSSFDSLTNADIKDVFIYDVDKITIKPHVVGDYGSIFRKFEREYINISGAMHYSISSINFSSVDTGYAVGGDFFYNKPIMLQTTDGTTWFEITPDTMDKHLTDIKFAGDNIYVSGFGGRIYRYIPDSSFWMPLETGTIDDIYNIQFVGDSSIFACGEKGTLLMSADSGNTWGQLNVPSYAETENFYSLDFSSIDLGYVVGANGTMLKVVDTGNLVQGIVTPVTTSLYDIDLHVYEEGKGYVVGANGVFLKLSQFQGADTIIQLHTGLTTPLNGVSCTALDSVYIAAENGVILFSEFSGDSLHRQFSNTSNHLRALYIQNDTVAWVAGAGLTILKTTNGGGGAYWPNDVEEIELAEPSFAVFPNPTSGKVSVEYELTGDAQVSLLLYDLAGRQMQVVFSQKQTPGIKRADFNVSGAHKGIYILILRINEFALSEKLIILD